jgi:hypothetical protein
MSADLALIPLLYLMRRLITAWLGTQQAARMREAAARD